MFSIFKSCSKSLLVMVGLVLACGGTHATPVYNGNLSLVASDPTQQGRLSRNNVVQDWSGTEVYPTAINLTTNYQYKTLDLDIDSIEAGLVHGNYVEISFDSTSTRTFLSAYRNSYDPATKQTNWLGDAGNSGNYFGTDPRFFQVTLNIGDHLILLLNGTSGNPIFDRNQLGGITVDVFSDTSYTDLAAPVSAVPEPGTSALMAGGLFLLAFANQQRGARRNGSSGSA